MLVTYYAFKRLLLQKSKKIPTKHKYDFYEPVSKSYIVRTFQKISLQQVVDLNFARCWGLGLGLHFVGARGKARGFGAGHEQVFLALEPMEREDSTYLPYISPFPTRVGWVGERVPGWFCSVKVDVGSHKGSKESGPIVDRNSHSKISKRCLSFF